MPGYPQPWLLVFLCKSHQGYFSCKQTLFQGIATSYSIALLSVQNLQRVVTTVKPLSAVCYPGFFGLVAMETWHRYHFCLLAHSSKSVPKWQPGWRYKSHSKANNREGNSSNGFAWACCRKRRTKELSNNNRYYKYNQGLWPR